MPEFSLKIANLGKGGKTKLKDLVIKPLKTLKAICVSALLFRLPQKYKKCKTNIKNANKIKDFAGFQNCLEHSGHFKDSFTQIILSVSGLKSESTFLCLRSTLAPSCSNCIWAPPPTTWHRPTSSLWEKRQRATLERTSVLSCGTPSCSPSGRFSWPRTSKR